MTETDDNAACDGGAGGGGYRFTVPVIYFDGQQESRKEDIVVSSDTDFNTFQGIMSQKLGLPSHQFTVYVKKRNSPRKTPVTEKVDFSVLLREKGSHFFAALKRPRRERRKKNFKENHNQRFYFGYGPPPPPPSFTKNPPANAMLLRRGMGMDMVTINNQIYPGFMSPVELEYEKYRLRSLESLQMQREKCWMNEGMRNLSLSTIEEKTTEKMKNQKEDGNGAVCEECSRAKETGEEEEAEFHCCVHDAVTKQFRSPAGPIARPVKYSD